MEGTIAEANEACLPDGNIAHPIMREELRRQLDQLAELYAEAVWAEGVRLKVKDCS